MLSLPKLPEGFRYRSELISSDDDRFLARLRELPFRDFEFYGYTGKRRFGGLSVREADASEQAGKARVGAKVIPDRIKL